MKLVALRTGPSLRDIPNMLRHIADEMEKHPDDDVKRLIWVKEFADGEIRCGALGEGVDKATIVGLLTLASRRFTPEEGDVERSAPD